MIGKLFLLVLSLKSEVLSKDKERGFDLGLLAKDC